MRACVTEFLSSVYRWCVLRCVCIGWCVLGVCEIETGRESYGFLWTLCIGLCILREIESESGRESERTRAREGEKARAREQRFHRRSCTIIHAYIHVSTRKHTNTHSYACTLKTIQSQQGGEGRGGGGGGFINRCLERHLHYINNTNASMLTKVVAMLAHACTRTHT